MAEATLGKAPSRPASAFKPGSKRNVRRPGAVTALDFDGRVLRAAQVTQRGANAVVTKVATIPVSPNVEINATDPAVMGAALGDIVERTHLRGSPIVLGIPRQMVVLRTLLLPKIDDVREMASMVHMQIGKELPFRIEDAVIDFKVHSVSDQPVASASTPETPPDAAPGVSTGAKLEVLVAAVRRETVDFYQRVAEGAKLKLIALGWLSEANARAAAACGWLREPGTVALITLRSEEVGIDIMAAGSLVFSRGTIFKKGDASTSSGTAESPNSFDALVIELVRSLHSYGGLDAHAPIARLVIAGATGREQALKAALQERFDIPCSIVDPAAALEISSSSPQEAAEALGAIGLGLGVNDPEGLPFDFLHPKRPAVQRNLRRIWTLAGCGVGLALLIGLLGLRGHLVALRMKIYTGLQSELAKSEKQLPTFRRMQIQAATLQTWTKDSRNWLEQFAYLSSVLPGAEDLYITSFNVSAQGNIHMAVQARSGEILAKLDRQLREAGYDVKPLAITPGSEKHGYNFRSTVELIAPVKMKVDLSKAQAPARPADDGSLQTKGRKGGGKS